MVRGLGQVLGRSRVSAIEGGFVTASTDDGAGVGSGFTSQEVSEVDRITISGGVLVATVGAGEGSSGRAHQDSRWERDSEDRSSVVDRLTILNGTISAMGRGGSGSARAIVF
jgi:hypothetical protein